MSKTTRATQFLDKAGVAYTVATYDYDRMPSASDCRQPRRSASIRRAS